MRASTRASAAASTSMATRIERIDRAEIEGGGTRGTDALIRSAERFENRQARGAKARLRQELCQCRRSLAVGGQGQDARSRLQMRAHQIERAAVYRNERGLRLRPAEAGGGQAEGRRRRDHGHLTGIDAAGERRADAIVERVARGEHADLAAAMMQDFVGGGVERARPRPRRAANERRREAEMAPAAKHDFGRADQPARHRAQALDAVLADADDGQPARRCGSVGLGRIRARRSAF